MMKQQIVELIKHKLVVGLVKGYSIQLVCRKDYTAESYRLLKKHVYQRDIKKLTGGTNLVPLEFAMHIVGFSQCLYLGLEISAQRGFNPEAADNDIMIWADGF